MQTLKHLTLCQRVMLCLHDYFMYNRTSIYGQFLDGHVHHNIWWYVPSMYTVLVILDGHLLLTIKNSCTLMVSLLRAYTVLGGHLDRNIWWLFHQCTLYASPKTYLMPRFGHRYTSCSVQCEHFHMLICKAILFYFRYSLQSSSVRIPVVFLLMWRTINWNNLGNYGLDLSEKVPRQWKKRWKC